MLLEEMKKTNRLLELFSSKTLNEFDRLVDEIYAPDYILHDPSMPDPGTGPEIRKAVHAHGSRQYPRCADRVQRFIAEGELLATRFTVYGTNTSTGQAEVTEVMCFSRFAGGKIVEEWQLGVPAKG